MARHPVVRATLTVRVPLGADGALAAAAASVVERIDAVESVDESAVCGLQPGLNDTTVDLRARLSLAVGERGEDAALASRELAEGVGVLAVESVEPAGDRAESDAPPPVPSPRTG